MDTTLNSNPRGLELVSIGQLTLPLPDAAADEDDSEIVNEIPSVTIESSNRRLRKCKRSDLWVGEAIDC